MSMNKWKVADWQYFHAFAYSVAFGTFIIILTILATL